MLASRTATAVRPSSSKPHDAAEMDINFDSVMQLMTSKYTLELVDRHVAAVRKIAKSSSRGFLLRHLEPLVELLRLVVQRFSQGQDEFAPALEEFIRVAALPFVSCKASDMITYGHHLSSFIKSLVSVLGVSSRFERVRIEVANTLACWSRSGLEQELLPDQPLIQAVADTGTPNLRILQQSQVIDELSASFKVEESPEAIVITLGAIRDMSLYRPLARQITNCGLLSNLVHVIRVNLLGSDVHLVAGEVLWNVLELDWEGCSEALGSMDVMESFRDFMEVVFAKGYRFKDKIFRNDMMVLLMYLSKKEENRQLFADAGLMGLLCSHAVSREKDTENIALTGAEEDVEFRVLIWNTLARCCSNPSCAEVAQRCGLVASLLSSLSTRRLEMEALSTLFLLVQHMPSAFREANGHAIVVRLLRETTTREMRNKCLHLLQVAVRSGFSEALGQLGAVGTLIHIFMDKTVPMNCRQLCASVLAGLCSESDANRREFRKHGGVEAIREEVLYRPDETTDNHLFFVLCVVDCIWCAVVGTRKNEVRFLDAGGLFAMLDVLEVAPLLLKQQLMGCLADMLEYKKAARLFISWNSQVTMKGGLKILLELWQLQQEHYGSTKDGVLLDTDRPLNPREERGVDSVTGALQASASSNSERLRRAMTFSDAQGRSVAPKARTPRPPPPVELGKQDFRAKIYAIVSCIGFACHETLGIAERQQMEVVKLFPECVQLETWIQVQEKVASIKPIAADRRWIEESVAERQKKTCSVQELQQELADERQEDEEASLERFYDDIRNRAPQRRNGSDGTGLLTCRPGLRA